VGLYRLKTLPGTYNEVSLFRKQRPLAAAPAI
jgi:hypothetical protein